MNNKPSINRRQWLKLGLAGAAGTVISASCESPAKSPGSLTATPACELSPKQELGPFPPMKALSQADHDVDLTMVNGQTEQATGDVMFVRGKVLDLDCKPLAGAIVVIWQSNHHGKYHHELDHSSYEMDPNFQGWGQAVTNEQGEYQFKTIKPGLYTGRTRHIHFKVSKRGYHELVTQLYFEGEAQNETDVLLNQLPHKEQLRLISSVDQGDGIPVMTFDMNIEAVSSGSVPASTLAEYDGTYELDLAEESPMMGWLREIGVTEEKILVTVSHEERQLFAELTSTPKAEVFWKSKDTFDAYSHYSSTMSFTRNDEGLVAGIRLQIPGPEEGMIILGQKRLS